MGAIYIRSGLLICRLIGYYFFFLVLLFFLIFSFLNSELKKRNSKKDFKKIKEKMSDWILVLIKKLLAENFKAARVDPYN